MAYINASAAEAASYNVSPTKPIRTLIVDDSPVARRTVSSVLEMNDSVQVIGNAEDGSQALEQVKLLEPDLVLMDMQMPVMDGLDATAQLRTLDPEVKVIIVTIHDSPELRERCRNTGAHGFVSKNRMHVDLPAEIRRVFASEQER